MDNTTQPTNEVVQPEVITEPVVVTKSSTNWLKILVFVVLGIGLLAGAVYGGMEIAKLQAPEQQPVVLSPTAVPEQVEETLPEEVSPEEASPSALPSEASPSAAIPADWETYTDSVNGYTFNYPSTFTQIPYSEGESKGIQVSSSTAGRSLSDGTMIKTLVVATSSAQLLAQQTWNADKNAAFEGSTATPMETITFNGKTAYSYIATGMGDDKIVIVPLSDNKVLRIAGYYAGTEPKLTEYKQQIDQIFSTFQFTD